MVKTPPELKLEGGWMFNTLYLLVFFFFGKISTKAHTMVSKVNGYSVTSSLF
jgi:hypothetical protein